MEFETVCNSVDETIELGCKIGSQLKGSEVFAICGELGSGKTHLIKGITAGVGAEKAKQVNSPTFVIINEYSGRFDIYHIDAYRLESVDEFEMLGFDDFCGSDSVVLIEWADKIESALKDVNCIRIKLFFAGQASRKIHIKNMPEYISL